MSLRQGNYQYPVMQNCDVCFCELERAIENITEFGAHAAHVTSPQRVAYKLLSPWGLICLSFVFQMMS